MSANDSFQSSNCENITAQLDRWVDDELSPSEVAHIEEHLASCGACRARFQDYRELSNDISALARAADRLTGAALPAPAVRTRRRVLPLVAAAMLVVTGVLLSLRVLQDQDQPTTHPQVAERSLPTPPLERGDPFSIKVDPRFLAVRMESSNPSIKIVWLYETLSHQIETESSPQVPTGDQP